MDFRKSTKFMFHKEIEIQKNFIECLKVKKFYYLRNRVGEEYCV
jgi:hypothetical protein